MADIGNIHTKNNWQIPIPIPNQDFKPWFRSDKGKKVKERKRTICDRIPLTV